MTTTTSLTKEQLGTWLAFLQAHSRVIRSLEAEMQEEYSLPLTWYDILVHLERAPEGKQRMQTLADSVLLSRSGLTRLLDRMTQQGLVDRAPCPEDRRGAYAMITEAGRQALHRAAPGHLGGVYEHFLRHLNSDDLATLNAALTKVLEGEEAALLECSPEV